MAATPTAAGEVRFASATGRWTVAVAAIGSGVAFLDGTVVNVALPALADDLGAGVSGLQWIVDAYLVTLSALLLLGGSLGDVFGHRRMFAVGLVGFGVASIACGAAPTTAVLVVARAVQGVTAALLVPASLALLSSTMHADDRPRAIAAWAALSGVSTALGPFVGGWLIDAVSWRLVFFINPPLTLLGVWVAIRHVPQSVEHPRRLDIPGAAVATFGLGALAYVFIEHSRLDATTIVLLAALSAGALVAFTLIERRSPAPMLPLDLFRSLQFTGANLTTLVVYAAIGGAMFLVVLQLQLTLGYSPLEAGAALLPTTMLLLALSSTTGRLAQQHGPRLLMTAGPLVMAAGLAMFTATDAGASYLGGVLPATVVWGVGLAITVAPLTTAVLAPLDEAHVGAGSAANNAVARMASLLAVAILPAVVGIEASDSAGAVAGGFDDAMLLTAGLSALGGAIAWATVRRQCDVETVPATLDQPCGDPALRRAG